MLLAVVVVVSGFCIVTQVLLGPESCEDICNYCSWKHCWETIGPNQGLLWSSHTWPSLFILFHSRSYVGVELERWRGLGLLAAPAKDPRSVSSTHVICLQI